jgi:hypothetical protein
MQYLYDPRTNVITQTNYDYLEELTGKPKETLASLKSRGKRIDNINCYILRENTTLKQRKAWYEKQKYEEEAWVNVKGSDGKFLISNYGRFKRVYKSKSSFLLPYLKKKTGYLEVKVAYDGIYKAYKVTNLVGLHFVGTPKPGQVLRHKNGIKTDDFAGNLEYIQKSVLGKSTGPLSKSKPVIQLDKVSLEVLGEFRSAREAGRKCYLSYQAVLDNCNHKSKSSGGYLFMFTDEYESLNLDYLFSDEFESVSEVMK